MSKEAKLAVIGHNISYSLSPVIHKFWMKKYEILGTYTIIDCNEKTFSKWLKHLREENYVGCNITIPHKEKALAFVNIGDHLLEKIKAVNTLHFTKEGVVGINTDITGMVQLLKELSLSSKRALILGGGGAARAITIALKMRGIASITVAARSPEKTKNIFKNMGKDINFVSLTESFQESFDLLVNTAPLDAQEPSLILKIMAPLQPGSVVMDLVYTPLETPLLKQAFERGHQCLDGLQLLLAQAQHAFHQWFGILPEIDVDLKEMVYGMRCE
jgi:shikimate dehydrogenase